MYVIDVDGDEERQQLVVDGKKNGDCFNEILVDEMVFSEDARKFAYTANVSKQEKHVF